MKAYELDTDTFEGFMDIIRMLRSPEGCPWDREQTHESLIPCMLEEAYEAVDAINRGDTENLREELGDVLLQVAMHAVIAGEKREFTIEDVIAGVSGKMIRRHPHVFGDTAVRNSGEVLKNWEEIKRQEHREATAGESLLKVPRALPAAVRAGKIQKKADKAGAGPGESDSAWDTVYEHLGALRDRLDRGKVKEAEEAYEDLLFAVIRLGRDLQYNAENSLTNATDKFINRFVSIERIAEEEGRGPREFREDERDFLWKRRKRTE